jgi:hypothetical protein
MAPLLDAHRLPATPYEVPWEYDLPAPAATSAGVDSPSSEQLDRIARLREDLTRDMCQRLVDARPKAVVVRGDTVGRVLRLCPSFESSVDSYRRAPTIGDFAIYLRRDDL